MNVVVKHFSSRRRPEGPQRWSAVLNSAEWVRALCCLLVLLLGNPTAAPAAIEYSGPTQIVISGIARRSVELDVNRDGIDDFYMFSEGGFNGCCNSELVPSVTGHGVASVPNSFYVTRFAPGSVIGSDLLFVSGTMANVGPADRRPPHEGNFVD